MSDPTAAASSADVAAYYRRTQWQYYGLWSGRDTLALHYGYWDAGVKTHRQALLRLNAVLAERAGVAAGDKLLDAGCGWGGSSIWLARERGAQCTGITLEPAQAGIAAMMARKRRVAARARFAQADFTRLPFADASFDVVWAVESVCHAPDKGAFLREAARVLVPGGRLVLADFFRAEPHMDATREGLLRAWISQWVVPDLADFESFAEAAKQAGLTGIQIEDATEAIRPSAARLYRTGLWTAPCAALFRLVRFHDAHQHANWLSSLRQYRALQAGAWRYGIVSARR